MSYINYDIHRKIRLELKKRCIKSNLRGTVTLQGGRENTYKLTVEDLSTGRVYEKEYTVTSEVYLEYTRYIETEIELLIKNLLQRVMKDRR